MKSGFPLIIVSLAMIAGLQSCVPDDEFSISGSILFDGGSSAPATVYLFKVSHPDAYQSIIYGGAAYPYVGASGPDDWYFDHRQQTAMSQKSVSGGSFEFNKVGKDQYYRVIAAGDEYGWIYSDIFKLTEDENIGTLTLYPETELPPVIDQDMTLESGHHYVVENIVQLHQDFTMHIEPGVWVRFKNSTSKLQVLGNLQANGDESGYIRFTYYDNSSSASNWSRLEFANDLDSLSAISYLAIDHASVGIAVNNCRISMDNVVVRHCGGTGISISSIDYSEIANCSIIDCSTGIDCNNLMYVDRCYLADCNLTGISLSNQSAYIDNSVIVNCGTGIREDYSDIFEIDHCIIAGNDIGMWFEAGNLTRMSVHYCDLYDNSVEAVYCEFDAYPDLSYNNFYQNEYNVYLHGQVTGQNYHQSGDVTALNCYWGETTAEEIIGSFHDGNTFGADPQLGLVLFDPFETTVRPDTGPE